jgi:hypothetical protein
VEIRMRFSIRIISVIVLICLFSILNQAINAAELPKINIRPEFPQRPASSMPASTFNNNENPESTGQIINQVIESSLNYIDKVFLDIPDKSQYDNILNLASQGKAAYGKTFMLKLANGKEVTGQIVKDVGAVITVSKEDALFMRGAF